MTNEEKYKTAKEQAEAFIKLCNCYDKCGDCPIYAITNGDKMCLTTWCDLEVETEEQSKEDLALKCEERKEMNYKVIGLKSNTELNCFTAKKDAIEWVDNLLLDVKNYDLLGTLNEIQAECNSHDTSDGVDKTISCFPNKFDMPLLLINLVLKEHGIRIDKK